MLFDPFALYSSTAGFGIGIGYRLQGITGPGSSLTALAEPSQRRGIYELAYFTGEPAAGRPFGAAAFYFEDTGIGRYYGIGPFSSYDERVFVEYTLARLRLTLGLPQRRLNTLIQPALELYHATVDSFENDDPMAFERLDPSSQAALNRHVDARLTHAAFGLEMVFGSADARAERSSIQGALHRVQATNGDGGFWRAFVFGRYGFPAGRNRVLLRAAFATILDGSYATVPIYLLPTLDKSMLPGYARDRFRGRSLVLLTANVERPLFDLLGYAGINLVLAGSVGSVYDDFPAQFTPRVSFASTARADDRAPLRPSGAIGLRAFLGSRPAEIRGVIGVSPEGFGVLTLGYRQSITGRRGLFW